MSHRYVEYRAAQAGADSWLWFQTNSGRFWAGRTTTAAPLGSATRWTPIRHASSPPLTRPAPSRCSALTECVWPIQTAGGCHGYQRVSRGGFRFTQFLVSRWRRFLEN